MEKEIVGRASRDRCALERSEWGCPPETHQQIFGLVGAALVAARDPSTGSALRHSQAQCRQAQGTMQGQPVLAALNPSVTLNRHISNLTYLDAVYDFLGIETMFMI